MPKRREAPGEPTPIDLRLTYLMHAAYAFYRAATSSENFASALNRIAAARDAEQMARRGIALPSEEEVYAYAANKWPSDRLHPLEGAAS